MSIRRVHRHPILVLTVIVALLMLPCVDFRPAYAATYNYPTEISPHGPTASGSVTVTVRSDPANGEYGPRLEYKIGSSYTKICSDQNPNCTSTTVSASGNSGRTEWTFTIPQQSATTLVELQLFNVNESQSEYGHSGFIYGYYVDSDSLPDHTVYIDGLFDFHSAEDLGSANGYDYYLTWDDTYFYVGFYGGDATANRYNVFFDVNPSSNTGATAAFAGASFPANAAPDYAVQWLSSSNSFYFATGSGSGWTSGTTGDLHGKDNGSSSSGVVELRIARSKVGLSSTSTVFSVYLTVANSSDQLVSAFPANNPQSSTSNLTTAWYYYSSYSGANPGSDGLRAPFSPVNVASANSSCANVEYSNQRKVAFVNGKWWVLYRDSASTNVMKIASSTDGTTWTEYTVDSSSGTAYQPSMWVDGNIIHVAWSKTGVSGPCYARVDTTDASPVKFTEVPVMTVGSAGDLATAVTRSEDGRLWLMQANGTSGKIYVSSDLGNSWNESLTSLSSGTGSTMAVLLPLRGGKVMAVYYSSAATAGIRYRIWDGSSWGSETEAPETGTALNQYDVSGAVDYLGNAYLIYKKGSTTYLESYDGSAWTQVSSSAANGHSTPYNAIGLTPVGNVYRSYRTSTTQLVWAKLLSGSSTWSTATQVGYDESGNYFQQPTLSADDRFVAGFTCRASVDQLQFYLVDILTAPRVPSHVASSSAGLYSFDKTNDSTPSLRFSSSDPGGQDITYQIQIDDDVSFGSPAVDATSTGTGFSNVTTPADTQPFNSGDTIEYTVQSALTDNTTYYWRVRAKDPNDYWSGWSRAQQFTVGTNRDLPTWHQNFGSSGYSGQVWVSDPIVLTGVFGSGSNWGEVYWENEEPGSADVKVSVWYLNSSGYLERIPDSALPGNSSGFDNNFVDLSLLNTTTYGTLYLRADLSGTGAKLIAWSITQKSTSATSQTVSRAVTTDADRQYSFGETGATIRFASDAPDSACTIQVTVYRNSTPTEWTGTAPVQRYYNVDPGTCSNYDASLTAGYADYQINSNTESSLKLWRYGSSWDSGGGTPNTTDQTVTRSGITAFSKWALGSNNPTAVDLSSFGATPDGAAIRVTWETASEVDNLGFNLYRGTVPGGPYTRLNATLIPARYPGMLFGTLYTWLDEDVLPSTVYYYKLEDIDVYGQQTFHGPVSAVSTAGTFSWQTYLPLIIRP